MLSRFYYTYKTDGTITRSLYTDDNLFQGQVGVGEYFLAPESLTDTNNILPTDAVLINFERPDGQTATLRMDYQSENGYWYKVSNGWETDVDITLSADLTISFTAKRYSTVSATTLVKKFQTDNATITITPSAQYSPLGLSSGAEDEIFATLEEHEVAIAANASAIVTQGNDIADLEYEMPLKVNTSDIVNSLTSDDTDKPLSAAVGPLIVNLINGKSKAVVVPAIFAMIATLNNANDQYIRRGDNIWIYDLEVPDFWVSDVRETPVTYTYTTDQALIDAIKLAEYVQIGYYEISLLETEKPDLTNFVEKTDVISDEFINGLI